MNDYEIACDRQGYLVYDYYGAVAYRASTLAECEAWVTAQEPDYTDTDADDTEF